MFTRANVYFTMLSYVTVDIIVNISDMYLAQLIDDQTNQLNEMYDEANAPKIKNRYKDINFWERSCINKIQRMIFKLLRCVYISAGYYFTPFLFLYMNMVFLIYMDVTGMMDFEKIIPQE